MNKIGRWKKRILILLAVLLVVTGGCAVYVSDYYRADEQAIEAFALGAGFEQQQLERGVIAFVPDEVTAGFIFYPGGKVEYTAYLPLMRLLASKGLLCILLKMPFNLAVLDVNAADGVKDYYPQVERWYIGGHSLGGSMAASYVSKHTDEFEGLVLLGSYSAADLSDSGLRVLSVFGSEDQVMDRAKYDKNRENLPSGFTETVIEGGCHAYFGMYGIQRGDGEATISGREQLMRTADAVMSMIVADGKKGK